MIEGLAALAEILAEIPKVDRQKPNGYYTSNPSLYPLARQQINTPFWAFSGLEPRPLLHYILHGSDGA